MNRYIKAMEIGLAHEEEGITYFDLVYKLHGTRERVFTMEAEKTFCTWFLENFSALEMDFSRSSKVLLSDAINAFLIQNYKGSTSHERGNNERLYDYLNQKWFLNGEASKQYLDYLELQESRLASQQARKQSNFSIVIAIVALIVTSIFGLASLKYQPETAQPPYDVKIIEDKSGKDQLEKENKELREELFKAEMMVKVLEEKSNK